MATSALGPPRHGWQAVDVPPHPQILRPDESELRMTNLIMNVILNAVKELGAGRRKPPSPLGSVKGASPFLSIAKKNRAVPGGVNPVTPGMREGQRPSHFKCTHCEPAHGGRGNPVERNKTKETRPSKKSSHSTGPRLACGVNYHVGLTASSPWVAGREKIHETAAVTTS